ncbi:MAG: serine hydrolase domain-containing protein, partial [Amphiplicatus sp.]
ERQLFEPLGMARSFAETGAPIPNEARFYEVEKERYKPAFRVDNSNKLPSGGLVSTPTDMLALGGQMIAPTLFGAATRDLLMTPQKLADGSDNPQGYALGWRYNPEAEYSDGMKTARLSHHGTAQGSTSYFAVLPEKGVVISVMMNKGQTNLDALGAEAEKLTLLYFNNNTNKDPTDS